MTDVLVSGVNGPPTSGLKNTGYADVIDFFKRPQLIGTYSWSAASVYTFYSPAGLWAELPPVLRKRIGYAGFRGNLHLRFSYSAMPYYYGEIICAGHPYVAQNHIDAAHYSLTRLSQTMNVRLRPNKEAIAELVIPYSYGRPFMRNMNVNDFNAAFSLVITPVATLQRADQGTVQNIPVNIFAWFENVVLTSPTVFIATSDDVESKISSKMSRYARMVGMLGDVPMIGQYASYASGAMSTVSTMLKAFGYSKPTDTSTMGIMVPRSLDNCSVVDVADRSRSLAMSQYQFHDVGGLYLSDNKKDVLAISTICGIESIISNTTWLQSYTTGTVFMTFPVSPSIFISNASIYSAPAVTVPALYHNYWTGSLIYRISVVSSVFHRGKLLIYHFPDNFATPTGDVIYGNSPSCVLDISTNTTVDFQVHNCDVNGYSTTSPFVFTGLTGGLGGVACPSGLLVIAVDTPLTSIGTTTSVQVTVDIRGGPDLRFNSPADNFSTFYQFVATSLAVSDEPDVIPLCVLNEPLMDYSTLDGPMFGESCFSLRNNIKRYTLETYSPLNQGNAANAAVSGGLFVMDFVKGPSCQTGPTTAGNPITGIINYQQYCNSTFSTIAQCFGTWRGSTRYKFVPTMGGSTTTIGGPTTLMMIAQNFMGGTSSTAPISYVYNYLTPFNNNTSVATARTIFNLTYTMGMFEGGTISYNEPLEITAPSKVNSLCQATQNYVGVGSNTDFVRLSILSRNESSPEQGIFVYKAAGDDMQFFNWIGFPTFVSSVLTNSLVVNNITI